MCDRARESNPQWLMRSHKIFLRNLRARSNHLTRKKIRAKKLSKVSLFVPIVSLKFELLRLRAGFAVAMLDVFPRATRPQMELERDGFDARVWPSGNAVTPVLRGQRARARCRAEIDFVFSRLRFVPHAGKRRARTGTNRSHNRQKTGRITGACYACFARPSD
jgi:hypothetical protein